MSASAVEDHSNPQLQKSPSTASIGGHSFGSKGRAGSSSVSRGKTSHHKSHKTKTKKETLVTSDDWKKNLKPQLPEILEMIQREEREKVLKEYGVKKAAEDYAKNRDIHMTKLVEVMGPYRPRSP